MMNPRASIQLLNLLNLLEDEFQNTDHIRIRMVFQSDTERSIDLPQDYDPQASDLHLRSGVRVVFGHKEFYFPEQWMTEPSRSSIQRQIEEIYDLSR